MTSPDIHALTGAYALDAVSGEERADFERHLAECESCAQEVRELRDTAAQLALAAAQPPPPAVKQRVLNEIRTVRQLPPDTTVVPLRRPLTQRLTAAAAALFFVAAAALGVIVVRQNAQLDDANAHAAQLEQILSAPDAGLVTLENADGASGNGTMRVAVSRSENTALWLSNDLANPAPGKTYQLWATTDDANPRSLGLLAPADGKVSKETTGFDGATGVAISVEPTGGSPQPTKIVMTGELPA